MPSTSVAKIDAANVLRRYLNQLPEPIVPLEFYERFREPLRIYQRQVLGEGRLLHHERYIRTSRVLCHIARGNRRPLEGP
jgi:hypothetical protein